MPRSRCRGGTRMPRPGDDTTRPAMLISPPVGCSSPATQRKVVVLPQPDGPSSTTISPAGTEKLTPSIAGRPTANCLRRSVTSSVPVMMLLSRVRSLPIPVDLVPIGDPGTVQFHVVVEFGQPYPGFGIEAFRIDRRHFQRGDVAEFPDHEGLAFERQAPVEKKLRRVRMKCGFRDARGIRIDRRTLGREDDLDRRAVLLL